MYPPAVARIGAKAPDFETEVGLGKQARARLTFYPSIHPPTYGDALIPPSSQAVIGHDIRPVSLTDYYGRWVALVFYPKDFTFVCPTEIIAFSEAAARFRELNAEVLFISTDTPESHLAYVKLPRPMGGLGRIAFPILADVHKTISSRYGVLLHDAGIALRGLFLIDPKGVLQQVTVNNLGVGRSVDETVRLLQVRARALGKHDESIAAEMCIISVYV